jgi:RHH-type proline utilization regulon transcriptional repressor/proline dehydrogenase/delta 1-pyrroline-5-carboxylate dehydrogenase
VTAIVDSFESLYAGIHGEEKKVLIKFKKWSFNQLKSFIQKEHKNHTIPGQISYNDYQLTVDNITMIASSDIPPLPVLLHVLSALAMGCGMTVMARSKKAYEWWNRIENILVKHEWHNGSFKVYFVNDSEMKESLKNVMISYLIVDGPEELVSQVSDLVSKDQNEREMMVSVKSLYDSPRVEDFKSYCLQYILVRSFAMNTMRHGAPLELDL